MNESQRTSAPATKQKKMRTIQPVDESDDDTAPNYDDLYGLNQFDRRAEMMQREMACLRASSLDIPDLPDEPVIRAKVEPTANVSAILSFCPILTCRYVNVKDRNICQSQRSSKSRGMSVQINGHGLLAIARLDLTNASPRFHNG
jgi:hypothetical protein